MAETMQVELVAPERRLASIEAESVALPGTDGDFTAMAGHAATATALRPGVVTVEANGSRTDYVIAGGFAEITPESVSILAEFASSREDATRDMFEPQREARRSKVEQLETGSQRHADEERDLNELEHMLDNAIPHT